MLKYNIILASKSKRRSKILKECGIPHEVVVSDVHEKMDHKKGAKFNVLYNARVKAEKVAVEYKKGYIIGADTLVLFKKRLIGKPKTRKEAITLLRSFSGKTVFVYTGLYLIDAKRARSESGFDVSKVHVKKLSLKKTMNFAAVASHNDKAGGFSIEGPGAFIFDNIEGSFYNVLGRPMMKLDELFEKLGVDLLGESIAKK